MISRRKFLTSAVVLPVSAGGLLLGSGGPPQLDIEGTVWHSPDGETLTLSHPATAVTSMEDGSILVSFSSMSKKSNMLDLRGL